ncbi:hypothetical protein [Enterobacter kobei]
MSPYQLILPANYLDYNHAAAHKLSLQMVSNGKPIILRAVPEHSNQGIRPFRLLTIAVPPVEASLVASYPDNLKKLEEQLQSREVNFSSHSLMLFMMLYLIQVFALALVKRKVC